MLTKFQTATSAFCSGPPHEYVLQIENALIIDDIAVEMTIVGKQIRYSQSPCCLVLMITEDVFCKTRAFPVWHFPLGTS